MDMNGSGIDNRRRVGSVKEAVSFFGERIADFSDGPSLKKTKMVCSYFKEAMFLVLALI